jgi:hypothetical protein
VHREFKIIKHALTSKDQCFQRVKTINCFLGYTNRFLLFSTSTSLELESLCKVRLIYNCTWPGCWALEFSVKTDWSAWPSCIQTQKLFLATMFNTLPLSNPYPTTTTFLHHPYPFCFALVRLTPSPFKPPSHHHHSFHHHPYPFCFALARLAASVCLACPASGVCVRTWSVFFLFCSVLYKPFDPHCWSVFSFSYRYRR